MKKFSQILLALLLIISLTLSSCSNEKNIQNEEFIDSFALTSNLLSQKDNEEIKGELLVSLSAGINFESSTVEVGLESNNESNSAYYEANLSAQTIIYLINMLLTNNELDSELLSSLSIYSVEDSTNLTEGGNKSAALLSFKASTFERFYLANESYLNNEENKYVFDENLKNYNISSNYKDVNGETYYTTTLSLAYNELKTVIPFVNLSDNDIDGEITIKTYQTSESDPITKFDIILYQYRLTSDNEVGYINIDITLSFDLPIGGDEDDE